MILTNNNRMGVILFLSLTLLCGSVVIFTLAQTDPQLGPNTKEGIWKGNKILYRPGEAFVIMAPATPKSQYAGLLQEHNLTQKYDGDYGRGMVIILPSDNNTLQQIASIDMANNYEIIIPNQVGHLLTEYPENTKQIQQFDDLFEQQWQLHNEDDQDMDAPEGWELGHGGGWGNSVGIVLMDSGIPVQNGQLTHPDLNDPGFHPISRFRYAIDYIQDADLFRDINGHGTLMAGNMAADTYYNDIGVMGVTWLTDVLVYKIADENSHVDTGDFYSAVWMACNTYSDDYEHLVFNASFGWPYPDAAQELAVSYAQSRGYLICAGTGNDGTLWYIRYPARYANEYDNVIAVGSTNRDGLKANTSNAGTEVTVAGIGGEGGIHDDDAAFTTAPGYNVSRWQLGTRLYDSASGTSTATAQTSGLAALIISCSDALSYLDVKQLIIDGAEKVGPYDYGIDGHCVETGYGRINIYNSLSLVPITGLQGTVLPSEPLLPKQGGMARTSRPPQHYKVGLTWDVHWGNIVTGYIVESSESSTGPWVPRSYSVHRTHTFYTDEMVEDDNTYYYRVTSKDALLDPCYGYSEVIAVYVPEYGGGGPEEVAGMLDPIDSMPESVTLNQNYPNPFNPSTQIKFGLPTPSHVRLRVMNIRGETVRSLVDDEMAAGWHTVTWDSKNEGGNQVASGIYLYLIEADGKSILMRMTLIR